MKNFRSHTTGANAWGNCEGLRWFPARLGSMMDYSEEPPAQVWERQTPWEGAKAWAAFCAYRDCGFDEAGERQERPSLLKFWRQYSGSHGAVKLPGAVTRWVYGLDARGIKVPGRLSWSERVAAYDDYIEARDRARREAEILRRRELLREIAWERVWRGWEGVLLTMAALHQMIFLTDDELPLAEDFRDLIPARDKLSILKVLGCLAQRELDAGMADCRADLGMLTGRTKLDIHVERKD